MICHQKKLIKSCGHGSSASPVNIIGDTSKAICIITDNHILLVNILTVHNIKPIAMTNITCCKVTIKLWWTKLTKCARPKQIELKIAAHTNTYLYFSNNLVKILNRSPRNKNSSQKPAAIAIRKMVIIGIKGLCTAWTHCETLPQA